MDGLDALRGIAALMVAVMHLQHIAGARPIFAVGYLAVDLFFVLSGYVIARTYEARLAAGMPLRAFANARLVRLWPTILVGAGIGMIAFFGGNPPLASLLYFLMAALLVPDLSGGHPTFPTNPPLWSIGFELFANVAHAFVLRFLSMPLLLAVSALSAAWLVAFAPDMNVGGQIGMGHLGIARVLFSYCLGIALWRWRRDRAVLPGWLGIVLLTSAILAMSNLMPWRRWHDFAFVFVLAPVIVASGIAQPPALVRRPLAWLGSISFPLYAVHAPVAVIVAHAGFGPVISLPMAIATAAIVKILVEPRRRRPPQAHPLPA